ncbi:MAG: hypothetical protein KAS70_04045, partial [Planctomycetes bacterium]|nr:hypothetical protein [Planctomycetota bacterium]
MIFTGLLRPALTARSDPSDLPADQASRQVDNYARGAWVTYRITRFQTKGAGLTKLWNSELKIISLGADEDSRFTWLEIITNEGKEYQKVIRFLINKNKRPIPKKLVIKVGALPPTEIDIGVWSSQTGFPPRRLFHDLTKKIIIIPINRLHHNETKVGSGSVRLKGPNPPPNKVGRASP